MADSGSSYTLLSERKWKECFDLIKLKDSSIRPVGFGGKPIEVLGEYESEFNFQRSMSKETVYVAKDDTCLLGWNDQKKLGILLDPNNPAKVILSRDYKHVLSVKGNIWKDEFPGVFREALGMFKGFRHKINVAENAIPKVHKVRRVPLALQAELRKKLDKLCEQDVIERIEPSDWVAPIVIARKANGSMHMVGGGDHGPGERSGPGRGDWGLTPSLRGQPEQCLRLEESQRCRRRGSLRSRSSWPEDSEIASQRRNDTWARVPDLGTRQVAFAECSNGRRGM
ncbi:hypothetical protein NDU88_002516 [Pleurodeles waltl]|uniref:Peptidase A2 domain-containing protein n=1 Tax=Pleurodeles waltl TaxID=8319 RepID=A0AAV7QBZ0_PLEWA|nr:hypothetical protein NDU88_002516 [Pleurodeles waltl]